VSGITRRDALKTAGVVGVVGAGAVGGAGVLGLFSADETPAEALVARFVGGDVPLDDPGSDVWNEAIEVPVRLVAQRVAPPFLDAAGLGVLHARALHNSRVVAFRLDWEDDSVDDLDGVRRYHDAVAVMLPTVPGAPPPITMGAKGQPVHIMQWRATWQRDIDGKTGVDQIYPNVVHDVMPDDVLPADAAADYWVGRKAGNPLSQVTRSTPVEQIVAEGFGTTTHVPSTEAGGRGAHDGEGWRVAIAVPRTRSGIGAPLGGTGEWHVSFAVWLGDRGNRGGRKHYADWLPLRFEAA
jgi:hypothetical protein